MCALLMRFVNKDFVVLLPRIFSQAADGLLMILCYLLHERTHLTAPGIQCFRFGAKDHIVGKRGSIAVQGWRWLDAWR